jgi:GT2 family glycosyltransferase
VDVCIPTCNRPVFLASALTSIALSECKDMSVYILDEGIETPVGSTGQLIPVFELLEARGIPVFYRRHALSKGIGHARNELVKMGRGEFVYFLDDDTVAEPRVIADMVRIFDQEKDTVGLYGCISDVAPFKQGDRITMDAKPEWRSSNQIVSLPILYECNVGNGTNLMWRRSVLEQCGGYDFGYWDEPGEDGIIMYRMLKHGRLFYAGFLVAWHLGTHFSTFEDNWRKISPFFAKYLLTHEGLSNVQAHAAINDGLFPYGQRDIYEYMRGYE